MTLPNLERFRFTREQSKELREEFALIASDVILHAVDPSTRGSVPVESGCYFWTLRSAGEEYRIYVGRTRSMRKRLRDYANEIQIHAPNDYKLRFFQEFVHEVDTDAAFDLYFVAVPEDTFKSREMELVKRFQPLINFLRKPTSSDRERIREGFRSYYRDAFAHRCAEPDTP